MKLVEAYRYKNDMSSQLEAHNIKKTTILSKLRKILPIVDSTLMETLKREKV